MVKFHWIVFIIVSILKFVVVFCSLLASKLWIMRELERGGCVALSFFLAFLSVTVRFVIGASMHTRD